MAAPRMNCFMTSVYDLRGGDKRQPLAYRNVRSRSQIASIEIGFFRRGCEFNEEQMKEGLGKTVGTHRSLKQVDVMKLKQKVAGLLI